MAQSLASFFVDDAAAAALTARVPNADYNSGMFMGGSNACGIGISTENPDLDESLPNWTLLDQAGNARVNQRSQLIGGPGITLVADYPSSGGQEGTLPAATIRLVNSSTEDLTGKGILTGPAGGAELSSLTAGWDEGA